MDMSRLGPALIKAGAPLLKGILENAVGGIGGKIAGAAVDALAESLGAEPTPDAVADAIERDPASTAPVVQQVEAQLTRTVDIGTGDLAGYLELLRGDQQSEGVLSRIWRPLFAIMYIFMFALQVVTALWLMWTRQWGTLQELSEVLQYLTFMNVAALAVLGIQIWKRTEEKKSGL